MVCKFFLVLCLFYECVGCFGVLGFLIFFRFFVYLVVV